LTVSLRPGAVGVAGPRSARDAVGRWLLAQLAALHSPVDLELAVLTADDGSWRWCRWLPHLRGRVASATDEWPAVVRDLLAVVDRRTAARRSASSAATSWPWLVVLIDPGDVRADVPGLAELVARGPAVGVTAVWLAPRAGALPSGCRAVVDIGGATGSTFVLMSDERHEGVLDQVSAAWADRVARALAPLIDADGDPSATLPPTCSLVDVHDGLLDPDVVVARWAAAGDGARTTVGRGADGDLVLDLAADGPHALVAGTTGAGKSELLQTLVVGLALEHPPEDLALLLVDYKGGAAFAECAGLPHTVGVVTDLDPHLTRRALRSLDAELLRREQRFAAAGAPDLTTYRARAGVPPVPRLVIVVDEFASLAGELPEFIPGLVGIARRGRSLGVHLVLATQRPGTAVSPEIRANTALRIALRVTDPNESTDVLDDPAAAGIDRRLPGRAVVRLGASLTHVQVAHASGVARADDAAVRCLGPWRSRPQAVTGGETDLARLVGAVRTAADRHGRHGHPGPWLPALPDRLALADLPATDDPLRVPFGLVDRPDVQRQDALVLDLARAGGWLVSGGARSGRSTACLTAVLAAADRVGPDRLQVAVVDPAARLGPLAALPHVSTACIGHGGDALRLLDRLAADLERRRRHLAGRGRSSFAEAGHGLPAQLVVVDGWEALTALSDELDGGRAAETLLAIARTGAAAGVTVLLTGDRTTLSPRVAGVFAHRMLLTPNDRGDFGLAGIGPKAVPAQLPPGRGLLVPEAAEVQLAVIADGPGATADLARRVAAIAARPAPRPAWPPVRIVPLPERVHVGDIDAAGDGLLLGVGGDTAEVVRWRPATHDALLVAGPPRSGRSTLLRLLLHQAHDRDLKPVVVAPARSPLAGSARRLGVEVLRPDGDPPPHLLDVVDPTLVLIDDVESLDDTRLGDHLHRLLRDDDAPALVVAAGRTDDIATSYRGLVAELRRRRCGVLLQPGPADGDLLGVRGPRRPSAAPPGRGIVVGDRTWDGAFAGGEPVPLQVALVGDDPGDAAERVTPC
ncbi:MAG: FtsK/SpoIIIE domain-containing protein, partial [Jatrophihabitans sp.]|uniref:FtsK/SpoIIIE domain-containing protein n=1 Tax=Jatrophihabitans sp. TaxID=1932789 RepID=UPI003F809395